MHYALFSWHLLIQNKRTDVVFLFFVLELNENFSHLLKYLFQLEYFNEREKHNRTLLTGFHRCKLIQHFLGTDEFLK